MTIDTEKLRALLAAATPGPWRWWTSNSMRRLSSDPSGKDGDVLHSFQASDGVPCVAVSDEDAALIAAAVNALPELLDALATAEQALKESREKVGNQRAQLRRFNRDGQAVSDALIGSMYEKSRLLKERTRALATAEAERDEAKSAAIAREQQWLDVLVEWDELKAERLTLARVVHKAGRAHLAVRELARRIVAEADAAKERDQ